jgi:hypothetical protein
MPVERPIYIMRIRPEKNVADPINALRRGLKNLLRQFGLRCISIEEEKSVLSLSGESVPAHSGGTED